MNKHWPAVRLKAWWHDRREFKVFAPCWWSSDTRLRPSESLSLSGSTEEKTKSKWKNKLFEQSSTNTCSFSFIKEEITSVEFTSLPQITCMILQDDWIAEHGRKKTAFDSLVGFWTYTKSNYRGSKRKKTPKLDQCPKILTPIWDLHSQQ